MFSRIRPYLHGSNCRAGTVSLDLEQAANASTIAIVAIRKKLPERALVVAYATALQESHIHNLAGGDRDSVGLFQQRPSQGWGAKELLTDPVYASNRFFDALVKVTDYLDRPVHDAAQQVQRSADGTAYAQHEETAKELAAAYTGRRRAAVRCWFSPKWRTEPRRTEAFQELRRSLGTTTVSGNTVVAPSIRGGWVLASWAVSHAQGYGLTEIRYAGRRWRSSDGHAGWTKDRAAPADRVLIR
jgi:hypothetical protein